MLPDMSIISNSFSFSKDNNNSSILSNTSYNNKKQKICVLKEKNDEEYLLYEDNKYKNIINERKNNLLNKRKMSQKIKNNENIISLNLQISKLDNFNCNNSIKYDKSKWQMIRFEKVRNKYIYVRKNNDLNESFYNNKIEKILYISHQINYTYYADNSFISQKKQNQNIKESNMIIHSFILISVILLVMIIFLIIFTLNIVQHILNKFDLYILKRILFMIICVITFINFLLYYFKTLISSFIIFNYFKLRKNRCIYKLIFMIFIDKTMIQIYKIKNFITKYKKEFDHL